MSSTVRRSISFVAFASLSAARLFAQDGAETRPVVAESRPAVDAVMSVAVNRSHLNPMIGMQVQVTSWTQDVSLRDAGEASAEGGRRIGVAFGHATVHLMHPFLGDFALDTSNAPPVEAMNPIAMMMMSYYLGYAGRNLTIETDAVGRIVKVEGLEAIQEAMKALGSLDARFKGYASFFETNATIFFGEAQVRRFLQPFFAQLHPTKTLVGEKVSGTAPHFIFTEAKTNSGVEWASEYVLEATTESEATIKIGGESTLRTPYVFADEKTRDPMRRAERGASRPSGDDRKAQVVTKSAEGLGKLNRSDGFWNELDLVLQWKDDKPAYVAEPGPNAKDETRTDRLHYTFRRSAPKAGMKAEPSESK